MLYGIVNFFKPLNLNLLLKNNKKDLLTLE
jgi:hypothetical protein